MKHIKFAAMIVLLSLLYLYAAPVVKSPANFCGPGNDCRQEGFRLTYISISYYLTGYGARELKGVGEYQIMIDPYLCLSNGCGQVSAWLQW
jgi:hypothetical protein